MYSVILMAAMATGGETTNCHFFCGCGAGCYGGCFGSCYGGPFGWYGACYGSCYGCYGCQGGYFFNSCYGCGGCFGCCGGFTTYGCGGCGGCYGYGAYAPAINAPGTVEPSGPVMPPAKGDTLPEPKPVSQDIQNPNRARLVVDLPADAKLYIDDQLMKTTSDHRSFNTPTLDKGQTYYYELRAEVVRDGKPVSVTRRVTLKAGDVVQTHFKDLESSETISTAKAR